MKYLLFMSIVTILCSCSDNNKERQSDSNIVIVEDTVLLKQNIVEEIDSALVDTARNEKKKFDTVKTIETEVLSYKEVIIDDMDIFPLYEFETSGFVPLTDKYQWNEKPDVSVISKKYLGQTKNNTDHILDSEHRLNFLNGIKVEKSTNVFIYNLFKDTIITLKLSELNIVARLSPYDNGGNPIAQYDYFIGIEIDEKHYGGSYLQASSCFVYIGEENPFIKGETEPILWKELNDTLFPKVKIYAKNKIKLIPKETYYFVQDSLNYFIRNLFIPNQGMARQLVVINSNSEKVIFNHLNIDSNDSYLNPLNGDEGHKNRVFQRGGYLFKDKPPVIFGFLGVSFGCPRITFIEEPRHVISIRCDNRH